jgi:hypothetical protein
VAIDLPEGPEPYEAAAETFAAWQRDGILVRDAELALWALTQDYTGPDGRARTRHGCSPAWGSRTTARAASARTSAPIRAPRRTGSG